MLFWADCGWLGGYLDMAQLKPNSTTHIPCLAPAADLSTQPTLEHMLIGVAHPIRGRDMCPKALWEAQQGCSTL